MVDVKQKIREKELMEADMENDAEIVTKPQKVVEKVDPFFRVQEDNEKADNVMQNLEKKVVLRNGNIVRVRKEPQVQAPKDLSFSSQYMKRRAPMPTAKREEKKEHPQTIKINPNAYRVKGVTAKDVAQQEQARTHIKF